MEKVNVKINKTKKTSIDSLEGDLPEQIPNKTNQEFDKIIEKSENNNSEDKYFSDKKFTDFELTEETLKSLEDLGYQTATEIQEKCIPLGLEGSDVIAAAKTGSGKSLAFLIPAVELIVKNRHKTGAKVLIITPTRELALQLFTLGRDLLINHNETCALVIGGANRKVEAEKLKRGVSLIIATPGRLLDHLQNTKGFNFQNISMLIIDEADDILKIGFEKELKEIIAITPKNRQTMLFSATMTNKVEDLITLSVKNYKFVQIKSKQATVSTLDQGYTVIEADLKFKFLYTFIKMNLNKKIMVFFSTCKAVQFYYDLLNYIDVPCKAIHGEHKQQKRSTTYLEFCSMEKGILLCTDVAQRGLDFPDVDWVIQYDPPHSPEEYLHRVGRTARGADKGGKAVLILLPSEMGMVRYLKTYKIDIKEYEFSVNKMKNIQDQLEKIINKKDHFLMTSATDAYRSYLHSYVAHTLKDVYDINNLDLAKVCKSFGLSYPPFVNLNMRVQPSAQRRKKMQHSRGDEKSKVKILI